MRPLAVFRRQTRTSRFAACVSVLVVLIAAWFTEHQNRQVFANQSHLAIAEKLAVIRAKLEGNVNANVQLARGLVAVIATEPDMDQARFEELARGLFTGRSHLRNIAASPDLVVSLMYPLEGNEAAMGLDYRTIPSQREAAFRVRDQGELVLAGPVDLVQGGRGLIGRYPVFTPDEAGRPAFWGMVSAVVDFDRLLAASGLHGGIDIDVALVGRDGLGAKGDLIYGSPEVLKSRPERMDVVLPSGTWLLAGTPKGGWPTVPPNQWMIRLVFAAGGALLVVPILLSGRLVDERHHHDRELRRREEELERLSQRLELALHASRIGIWDFEPEKDELYWDERMKELYGLDAAAPVRGYETWREMLYAADLDRAEHDFDLVVNGAPDYQSEFRIQLADGRIRHVRAIGSAYLNSQEKRRIVGVNWDVSADVELHERLKRARDLAEARSTALEEARVLMEHNAHHDPLTGLPNRRYLDRILEAEAKEGKERPSALIHLDLDRFKQINDTLGHAAGDRMLQHAARVLQANVRPSDFVARIGGDEFVIVTRGATSAARLARLAARIIEAMRKPVRYEAHECRTGVSVGIAKAGPDTVPRQLLVNADIALYEAKSNGRSRYEFFTEKLQTAVISIKRTADDLMRALERDEFVPFFQPQFDARTLAITGAEVLVRWQHPDRGLLLPSAFLQTAEDINVVSAIDQRILEKAMLHFYRWQGADLSLPKISLNVSSNRLHDEALLESLKAIRFQPGQLAFELLESTFLDDGKEIVAANIRGMKEMGIEIEIDDFGTGYASIVSLLKLKPQRLKIDRQLVMPVTRSAPQRHLVSSIIDIGRSLQIEVIAEGVETMEHVRILRRIGCTALQGYALAEPMSANDFTAFVKDRRPATEIGKSLGLGA